MRLVINTLDGVTHDANVLPVDLVRFERAFDTSLADMGDSPKMEHLLFLAHSALNRTGDADPDFEVWMETVADAPEVPADPLDQPAS